MATSDSNDLETEVYIRERLFHGNDGKTKASPILVYIQEVKEGLKTLKTKMVVKITTTKEYPT